MRSTTPHHPCALSAAFVGSACLGASAHRNINMQSKSDDVRRCSDLSIEFDDEPAVTAEETLTAPASSGSVLTVRSPQNGGVYVLGKALAATSPALTTCKAVAPATSAREQLDAMHTTVNGGTVSTTGSSSDDSVVFYIVEAPAGGTLDLSAHNGPISVREFSGRSTMRTQNGPVSLKNVGGTVNAFAQNGPIQLRGRQRHRRAPRRRTARLASSWPAPAGPMAPDSARPERAGPAESAGRVHVRRTWWNPRTIPRGRAMAPAAGRPGGLGR